jgi:hypothetical protein
MLDEEIELMAELRYDDDMETRIAILEQIAKSTAATLERMERRLDTLAAEQRTDFRWTLGITLAGTGGILGALARGFHWL